MTRPTWGTRGRNAHLITRFDEIGHERALTKRESVLLELAMQRSSGDKSVSELGASIGAGA